MVSQFILDINLKSFLGEQDSTTWEDKEPTHIYVCSTHCYLHGVSALDVMIDIPGSPACVVSIPSHSASAQNLTIHS